MTRKELKQYRSLKTEIHNLETEIDKLRDKLEKVPAVWGKVTKSSDEFPYTVEHVSVRVPEPKEAAALNERIRIKELRRDEANDLVLRIELFIDSIPDSVGRQVFDMVYLQGMRQQDVADEIGYSRGRIPQIISSYLKD